MSTENIRSVSEKQKPSRLFFGAYFLKFKTNFLGKHFFVDISHDIDDVIFQLNLYSNNWYDRNNSGVKYLTSTLGTAQLLHRHTIEFTTALQWWGVSRERMNCERQFTHFSAIIVNSCDWKIGEGKWVEMEKNVLIILWVCSYLRRWWTKKILPSFFFARWLKRQSYRLSEQWWRLFDDEKSSSNSSAKK